MNAHSEIWELNRTINRRQEELQKTLISAVQLMGNTTRENIRQLTGMRDALRDDNRLALINNSPVLNIYSKLSDYDNTFTGEDAELFLKVVKTVWPDITTIQYSRFGGQSFTQIIATPEELAQLATLEEKEKQEEEEDRRQEKIREINVALVHSRIPDNLWDVYTFKDFKVTDIDKNHSNKEAYRLARQFAGADPDDENAQDGWHNFLTYIGTPGSGKTRLALTVGLYIIKSGDETFIRYWQVQDLFEVLKGTFNKSQQRHNSYDGNNDGADDSYNKIIESLKECSTLILDDLGAENGTEWVRSILDMVIDYRYSHELKTIITSNASDVSELPPRIASRLSEGNICKILMPDFRKVKALQRENKNRKVTK